MALRRLAVMLGDRLHTDSVRLYADSTAGELLEWAETVEGVDGRRRPKN